MFDHEWNLCILAHTESIESWIEEWEHQVKTKTFYLSRSRNPEKTQAELIELTTKIKNAKIESDDYISRMRPAK